MVVSVAVRGDTARVTIDNPPVNAASRAVRQGLMEALAETEADPAVKAVVLSCEGRTFSAGADVSEFGRPPAEPHLPDVIDAIEGASRPWTAALHGTVLGGGLELAMGCSARIAAPGTTLGLPEVTLGLIPGAGGTARLPRLVPAHRALDMIAGGRPVTAEVALTDGLIDRIAAGDLLEEAASLARQTEARGTIERPLRAFDRAEYRGLAARTRARARGQISPLEALAAVDRALKMAPDEAKRAERDAFLRLKHSAQSAALRHIFFAERKTLRDPRTKGPGRPFADIGVIGGGTMGTGIAAACLMRGLRVRLVEQAADRAGQARRTIAETLAASGRRGLVQDPDAVLESLTASDSHGSLSDADLVIEAVFEDMDLKKRVFRQVEAITRPDAVIATNTSYLDVNEIAGVLDDPSRAIGLHFFYPAHIMKLLEIVLPDAVADDAVATAARLARRLGKIGTLSGVCDGFIGNRIMSAYRHEADLLLMEGAAPGQVDAAMRDFGFAIGIFEMQDLAGLDIAWAMRKRRLAEGGMPEGYVHVADRLCEAGRFGRKADAGWYDYRGGAGVPSDFVASAIAHERSRRGVAPRPFARGEIMDRILRRMQSEAEAVLSEGIAQSAADIDVVMVNGYGFPRWRGGPSMC